MKVKNKQSQLQWLQQELAIEPQATGFVGDDLNDLVVRPHVGLLAAPADACQPVRRQADLVLRCRGGHGAVRELAERILQARGEWADLAQDRLASEQLSRHRSGLFQLFSVSTERQSSSIFKLLIGTPASNNLSCSSFSTLLKGSGAAAPQRAKTSAGSRRCPHAPIGGVLMPLSWSDIANMGQCIAGKRQAAAVMGQ